MEAVAALDPNTGEGRAFEIIESLGRLMWTVDRAALVFCIDQVEDLRFFDDPEERFQKAVRDLIQIANRVPTSIVSSRASEDFYGQVRGVLAQSYIDRIEKSGPVALLETPHAGRGAADHRQAAGARGGRQPAASSAIPTLALISVRSSSRSSAGFPRGASSSRRRPVARKGNARVRYGDH